LSVDQTLEDAAYGIERMKANGEHFNFYFKGTLACLKGGLDYLLEEYNSKYSLGITDAENLNPLSFADKAKTSKNSKAQSFIKAYDAEREKLLSDPKCKKLLGTHGTRDIAIHRRTPTRNVQVHVHENIRVAARAEVRDERGNLIAVDEDQPEPVSASPPPGDKVLFSRLDRR
jgi:hypothetical protein